MTEPAAQTQAQGCGKVFRYIRYFMGGLFLLLAAVTLKPTFTYHYPNMEERIEGMMPPHILSHLGTCHPLRLPGHIPPCRPVRQTHYGQP